MAGYHVCGRSNNRDWFLLPLTQVWKIFCDVIEKTINLYGVNVHAFVLMANHFHAVLSTPREPLDVSMRYFMTESSRSIARSCNRINHVYGGRYKWSLLTDAYSYAYVLKYVLRNPVRAGIVENVDDYEWSSWSRNSPLVDIALVERIDALANLVPKTPEKRSDWLNIPTPKEQEELIRLGLRKYKFEFSKYRDHKKILALLKKGYGID